MFKGKLPIEKFSGKGGWTFIAIPDSTYNPQNPFGWETVSGKMDNIPLTKKKLMPRGDGTLFLPINAKLKKQLKKEVGDFITLEIQVDSTPTEIPKEIVDCINIENNNLLPVLHKLSESEKKKFIDYIYESQKEETKTNRIISFIEFLEEKKLAHDKGEPPK